MSTFSVSCQSRCQGHADNILHFSYLIELYFNFCVKLKQYTVLSRPNDMTITAPPCCWVCACMHAATAYCSSVDADLTFRGQNFKFEMSECMFFLGVLMVARCG